MCYAEKVWAEEARAEGMKLGIEKGIEKGRIEGIRNLISACRSLHATTSVILQKLQAFYGLSSEEAMVYLSK